MAEDLEELEEAALLDLPTHLTYPNGDVIETRWASSEDLYLAAAAEALEEGCQTTWDEKWDRVRRVWSLRWLAERRRP